MVYLFKAQASDKVPLSFYDKIEKIIESFDPKSPFSSEDGYDDYVEWSINPLPGVTLEQATTVFNAVWEIAGEIDPDVTARIFER